MDRTPDADRTATPLDLFRLAFGGANNKAPEYVDPAAPDLVGGLRARERAAGPRREAGSVTNARWNLVNLGTGHRPVFARPRSRPPELPSIPAQSAKGA
ncbi:hypothetical protein ACIHJG_05640 [Streptomyces sp. NPDC052415]|uniref:hypothetical protein n=1 Tax=Streptomyces sp. NPDC052415 TaxID=3365690 RepID=UPI0037D212E6